MTLNTPFATVFAGYEGNLPRAFKEQFLATPEWKYKVVLEGTMHEIEFRPRWLKPLFVVAGWLGILISRTGRNIRATLEIEPGYLPDGQPYHEWNRTLAFDPPVHFNTTVVYDRHMKNIADVVGRNKFLHMVWKGRFTPPRRFTLNTVTYAVKVGMLVWYMPRWLWLALLGSVDLVQDAHEDNDRLFDIHLRILHPWFGEIYTYRGTFEAK